MFDEDNPTPEEQRRFERGEAQAFRIVQSCKALFLGALGQEVLKDLEMEFSERTSVAMQPGPIDPLRMAYLEGQRSVILTIRHRLAAPEEEMT